MTSCPVCFRAHETPVPRCLGCGCPLAPAAPPTPSPSAPDPLAAPAPPAAPIDPLPAQVAPAHVPPQSAAPSSLPLAPAAFAPAPAVSERRWVPWVAAAVVGALLGVGGSALWPTGGSRTEALGLAGADVRILAGERTCSAPEDGDGWVRTYCSAPSAELLDPRIAVLARRDCPGGAPWATGDLRYVRDDDGEPGREVLRLDYDAGGWQERADLSADDVARDGDGRHALVTVSVGDDGDGYDDDYLTITCGTGVDDLDSFGYTREDLAAAATADRSSTSADIVVPDDDPPADCAEADPSTKQSYVQVLCTEPSASMLEPAVTAAARLACGTRGWWSEDLQLVSFDRDGRSGSSSLVYTDGGVRESTVWSPNGEVTGTYGGQVLPHGYNAARVLGAAADEAYLRITCYGAPSATDRSFTRAEVEALGGSLVAAPPPPAVPEPARPPASGWNALPAPELDCTDALDGATEVHSAEALDVGGTELTFVVRSCLASTTAWPEVVQVYETADGSPRKVATLLSEMDGATSVEVAVSGTTITLTGSVRGPDDPGCCPSGRLERSYELVDGRLVAAP